MAATTRHRHHVAVVGSINRDHVTGVGVTPYRGWGGILFNIAALLRHCRRDVRIQPIAYLGSDASRALTDWLTSDQRLDIDSLIPLARRGNLCRLRYHSPDERTERLLYRVPPLRLNHLRWALHSGTTLVNFISGCDLSIQALEHFRREYRGLIYIDVHSLLLGRRRDGARYHRRPAHWQRVMQCGDVLQVNEREFFTLSKLAAVPDLVRTWVRRELSKSPCKAFIVTRGPDCVILATRRGRDWHVEECPVRRRTGSVDPTGAGDTFSGAWIAHWLTSRNAASATRFAAREAAQPARPPIGLVTD